MSSFLAKPSRFFYRLQRENKNILKHLHKTCQNHPVIGFITKQTQRPPKIHPTYQKHLKKPPTTSLLIPFHPSPGLPRPLSILAVEMLPIKTATWPPHVLQRFLGVGHSLGKCLGMCWWMCWEGWKTPRVFVDANMLRLFLWVFVDVHIFHVFFLGDLDG